MKRTDISKPDFLSSNIYYFSPGDAKKCNYCGRIAKDLSEHFHLIKANNETD